MPKLKNKQYEEFCQQYIVDFNGARAAYEAGGSKNKKVARVTASHWLKRPAIRGRILELLEARSKRTKITQDRVLQELAFLGFSDFTEFAKYTKEGGLELENTKDIKGGKTCAIKSMKQVDTKEGGSISIKLHSKERPLELMGKHLGIFVDKFDVADDLKKILLERVFTDKRPKE